jgi:lipopolysaccharide export system protein LptC
MASTTLPTSDSDKFSARRRRRFAARSRHSRYVGILKVVLPSIAVGLILLLVVWSQMSLDEKRFRIGLTELAPEEVDSLSVVNARYEGIDKQNRPFTVTAARAVQLDEQTAVIDLTEPRADITLKNGAWLSISADAGRFARNDDQLDLRGSVSLFHDRGFEFHAETVRIDLEDATAVSTTRWRARGRTATSRRRVWRCRRAATASSCSGGPSLPSMRRARSPSAASETSANEPCACAAPA